MICDQLLTTATLVSLLLLITYSCWKRYQHKQAMFELNQARSAYFNACVDLKVAGGMPVHTALIETLQECRI